MLKTLKRLLMPAVRDNQARPRPRSAYMRNDMSPFLAAWQPGLREASQDVRQSYVMAAARTIDMMQNSGWISGAVDQSIAYIVGTGMRLASKPDATALGWTTDEAAIWAQDVERRWESFADRPIECDIEGKSTIGKMQAQAVRSHFCYGEVLAALPYLQRKPGGQYGTKVQMLPPSRLVQDSEPPKMVQGVIRDDTGFPLAYRIKDPPDTNRYPGYLDRPARDEFGRTQMVHVFDGQPGQVRGIAPMTPALKVVRQFDQLADATLTAALIQTIFAATIKSPDPTEQAMQAFQALAEQEATAAKKNDVDSALGYSLDYRADFYDNTKIDLGHHGKIAHLAPGDELTFNTAEHPTSTYESFAKFLLREIARCLGLTYEDCTGDYAGATYSSVRMATSSIWMTILNRRANIVSPLLSAIFEAWLEEEIEKGWTPFPGGVDGFIENRAAAARCHWRGPAKPQADDAKFATAVKTLRELGVVTDEWICAEMGEDWEDIYEQRQREMQKREELGLPEAGASAAPAINPFTGQPAADPMQDPTQQDAAQPAG